MKVTKSQTGKALTIFKFATNTLMKPMDFIRGLTVNEKRKNLGRLLSATAILCFGACKQDPEAGADTKSLDNFARGGETAFEYNWCSGYYKVKARDLQLEGSDEEKSAIRAALSAVPEQLQEAFFDGLKGKIVVTNARQCVNQKQGNSAESEKTLACWKPGKNEPIIYITKASDELETRRNIMHSVVRSMGFILTDIIFEMPAPGSSEPEANKHITETLNALTAKFKLDLKDKKDFVLPVYMSEYDLNKNIFAESFDSWYCSVRTEDGKKNTRDTMKQQFKLTSIYFDRIAEELLRSISASPEELAAANQASGEGEGFDLWGRWGGGNGPIRQGLSNWARFRQDGGGLFNATRFNAGGGYIFQRPWFNPFRWGG